MSVLFELEASGFTHLSGRCNGCGETISRSFTDIRKRLGLGALTSIEATASQMACDSCPDATAIELTPIKRQRKYRGGPS